MDDGWEWVASGSGWLMKGGDGRWSDVRGGLGLRFGRIYVHVIRLYTKSTQN